MGRVGVSYLEVADVAESLQSQGRSPTVDSVREILGTGSKSTIAPYLKQWREKFIDGRPQNGLSEPLALVVKNLHAQLINEAEKTVLEQQELHSLETEKWQSLLTSHQEEAKQLNSEVFNLTNQLGNSQQSQENLKEKLEAAYSQNLALNARLAELERYLEDKKNQVMLFEQQLAALQANLEHYREAMLNKQQEEKTAFERERSFFTQDINSLKKDLAAEKNQNQQNHLQLQTHESQHKQLELENNEIKTRAYILQEKIDTMSPQIATLGSQNSQLQNNLENTRAKLLEEGERLQLINSERDLLQERLNNSGASSDKMQNLIKILQEEQLSLIKENAYLKGQLKHSLEQAD